MSIKRFGVLVPIIRDQAGNILDGHHRAAIANQLGIEAPERSVEAPDDPDEKAALIGSLNDDRRQRLTAEQRREIVAALRQAGHFTRAIAGAVGVSQTQVRNDMKQLNTSAQLTQPDKIQSLDGKDPPATNGKPTGLPMRAIESLLRKLQKAFDKLPADREQMIADIKFLRERLRMAQFLIETPDQPDPPRKETGVVEWLLGDAAALATRGLWELEDARAGELAAAIAQAPDAWLESWDDQLTWTIEKLRDVQRQVRGANARKAA